MGCPAAVTSFGKDFSTNHSSLSVLVNNAGCMLNERRADADGLEGNFAVNTLGTYLLTEALLPLLETSEKPRVITVSSGGMLLQRLEAEDLQYANGVFDGQMAYARNKRQQVVLTEVWAAAHPKVYFSSMHPGWADTPAVRQSMPEFHAQMGDKLRTPEQGADCLVWLAVCDAVLRHPSGEFFQDRVPVSKHLPLATTKHTPAEQSSFMTKMEAFKNKYL